MQICEFPKTSELPFPVCEVSNDLQITAQNQAFQQTIGTPPRSSITEIFDNNSLETLTSTLHSGSSSKQNSPLKALKLKNTPRWFDTYINSNQSNNVYSLILIEVTAERKACELIDAFTKSLSLIRDDDFYLKICSFLCERLGYEFALIGQLISDSEVETLACVGDKKPIEIFSYPLAGTPCEHVVGRETCVFQSNIQTLFPEDIILQEINVDSYIGTPCFNSFNKPTGLIAVMGRSPILDAEFTTQMIEMFAERISAEMEKQQAYKQLSYQASHDSLCDIPNRRYFQDCLKSSLDDARHNQTHHVLLYLDLDQFKIVNDTCGHIAGDELLVQISILLKQSVNEDVCLARIGGDEFGIIFRNCSLQEGVEKAQICLTRIHQFQFVWQELLFKPAASIGITPINQASSNTEELLKQADTACYIAKENGRNRYFVYQSDTEMASHENSLQLIAKINSDLENDAFTLFAQAISPSGDDHNSPIKHYEVLLRTLDSEGNPQSPHLILTAAERYDMATLLDEWVIKRCLKTLSENRAFIDHIDMLTVNLSGQSLGSAHISDLIKQQLTIYQLPPEKFCFEITETTAISMLKDAVSFIQELKEIGCYFALDDFGSGLSSMNYLKHLPVDFLKIDGTFVREICMNNIDHAMVKSINEMSHVLNMRTIAEFVENDDIKHKLQALGVDFLQGFGIAKPQPLEEIIDKYNMSLASIH